MCKHLKYPFLEGLVKISIKKERSNKDITLGTKIAIKDELQNETNNIFAIFYIYIVKQIFKTLVCQSREHLKGMKWYLPRLPFSIPQLPLSLHPYSPLPFPFDTISCHSITF